MGYSRQQGFLSRLSKYEEYVDTLMALAEKTDFGASAYDMINHARAFASFPSLEAIWRLLLHPSVWTGVSEQEDIWVAQYALMKTLKSFQGYSGANSDWHCLIRRLLRKGVDIHGGLRPRCTIYEEHAYIRRLSSLEGNSTPLDELYAEIQTPFEANAAADCWLDILSQEGHDIGLYLQREHDLHAADQQLTNIDRSTYYQRQLIYYFEGKPSVSFEWHASIDCVTLSLWQEFIQMNVLSNLGLAGFHSSDENYWKSEWPFSCSAGSPEHVPYPVKHADYPEWRRCANLFQGRAIRRSYKKSLKMARTQKVAKSRKMPGAWPV